MDLASDICVYLSCEYVIDISIYLLKTLTTQLLNIQTTFTKNLQHRPP